MVRNEDNLHVLVLGAQEAIQEEKEAACQVFLHGVHGTRGIHNAHDHSIGFPADLAHAVPVGQIIIVKGESLSLHLEGFIVPASCQLALDA